jgi:hypothetical protein
MGKFIISNLCDANYDNWNFFSNLENNKNVFKFFRENEVIIENTENCLLNDLLLNIQNLCRDNDISNQINNIFNIIRNILFDKYETMNENYPLHYLSLFIEKFLFIIKQVLLMNGINIKNKDEHQDETISLNAIIRNNNETLIKIYGEKFYSLLNFFFCDKFGLNIRNALLHGEEISLIQKNYSDWMLYIFFTMILYGDSKY